MNKSKGFTLVEVLISAIILFSVLALAAEIYNSSTFSANKAAKSARFFQIHPAVISAIKLDLRSQARNKKKTHIAGELNVFGMYYTWQSERISFLPKPKEQDSNTESEPQFGMFEVLVQANQGTKIQSFSFQVATW